MKLYQRIEQGKEKKKERDRGLCTDTSEYSTREESLEAIVDAFSTHHVSSYIDNRHEEVLGLLKRSLSKYNNPKEASLAARAIALTFINLDDISEGDSDNYYKRIVPSLKNAIMDSEEVDVKVDVSCLLYVYIYKTDF